MVCMLAVCTTHLRTSTLRAPRGAQAREGLALVTIHGLRKWVTDLLRELRSGVTQRLTIHGLRRTATDLLRRAAVDPVEAKAIIGHTTDRMREH
ncbi:MAG: hypothetical protein JWN04_340 [Myxococcaceae bacterium]|nr:hypothetical protein [Myxococcaceae bacterium]